MTLFSVCKFHPFVVLIVRRKRDENRQQTRYFVNISHYLSFSLIYLHLDGSFLPCDFRSENLYFRAIKIISRLIGPNEAEKSGRFIAQRSSGGRWEANHIATFPPAETSTLVDIPEQFYSYATHELFHYFHCGLAHGRSANKHTIIIHGLVCSRAPRSHFTHFCRYCWRAALLFASIYQLIVNFAAYSAGQDKKGGQGKQICSSYAPSGIVPICLSVVLVTPRAIPTIPGHVVAGKRISLTCRADSTTRTRETAQIMCLLMTETRMWYPVARDAVKLCNFSCLQSFFNAEKMPYAEEIFRRSSTAFTSHWARDGISELFSDKRTAWSAFAPFSRQRLKPLRSPLRTVGSKVELKIKIFNFSLIIVNKQQLIRREKKLPTCMLVIRVRVNWMRPIFHLCILLSAICHSLLSRQRWAIIWIFERAFASPPRFGPHFSPSTSEAAAHQWFSLSFLKQMRITKRRTNLQIFQSIENNWRAIFNHHPLEPWSALSFFLFFCLNNMNESNKVRRARARVCGAADTNRKSTIARIICFSCDFLLYFGNRRLFCYCYCCCCTYYFMFGRCVRWLSFNQPTSAPAMNKQWKEKGARGRKIEMKHTHARTPYHYYYLHSAFVSFVFIYLSGFSNQGNPNNRRSVRPAPGREWRIFAADAIKRNLQLASGDISVCGLCTERAPRVGIIKRERAQIRDLRKYLLQRNTFRLIVKCSFVIVGHSLPALFGATASRRRIRNENVEIMKALE